MDNTFHGVVVWCPGSKAVWGYGHTVDSAWKQAAGELASQGRSRDYVKTLESRPATPLEADTFSASVGASRDWNKQPKTASEVE